MSDSASRFARAVRHVCLLFGLAPVLPASSSAQISPTVTISPHGQLVTTIDRTVDISVEFCQNWGENGMTNQSVTMNGQDISYEFNVTGIYDSNCDYAEEWTATIALDDAPQNQTISAQASDNNNYWGGDDASFAIPAPRRGVMVTSAAGFVTLPPSTASSQQFTVWNTGAIGTSYALSMTCAGAPRSCSVSPSSVTVAAGQSANVTVSYTSSPTLGDTGSVTITANDNNDWGSTSAKGWSDLTVKAAAAPGVVLSRALDLVPRSSCVTANLGDDAAMECGDLTLAHALPAVTTFGAVRAPTLIYNSQAARPMPMVFAQVTVPAGTLPTTVEARVYVDGVQRGFRSFAGGGWGSGGSTRSVVVDVDASSFTTSLHSFYMQVSLIGGPGGTYTSPTVSLAIVNRTTSNFGAGWWLAGLESLYPVSSTTLLWVGGDGSTRVYTGSGSTFIASKFDRPDTITYNGSTAQYTRHGPGNLQVTFNSSGLHVSTTNRLGQVTTFAYVPGTHELSTITLPVVSGSAPVYSFSYDANGVLQTVTAPGGRTVSVGRTGFRLDGITDPDGNYESFGYSTGSNQYLITAQRDRDGNETGYSYNSMNRLIGSSLNMNDGTYITQAFRPVDSQGLDAAQPLDSMYTLIDGPRSDVADVTKIWINQYGAPTRIRNAEGRETLLTYDATWPGLIAQTRSPNQLLTTSVYDANTGLPASTTAYNPLGNGLNSTTSYTWDAKWRDITSITSPNGVVDSISYDPTYGNRVWEQTGGSTHRVNYGYDSSHLLNSITPPGLSATTIAHNALGNVSRVTDAKGYKTFHLQNAIGRDTLVASPFSDTTTAGDSATVVSSGSRVKTWYDILGRDTATVTSGPAVSGMFSAPADSLKFEHSYDPNGNVLSATRRYWRSNCCGAGYQQPTAWVYDAAGRPTSEEQPDGATKTFNYDPAGNVTAVTSSRGYTVSTTYDVMNRPMLRVTPQVTTDSMPCWALELPDTCQYKFPTIGSSVCFEADTAVFGYDPGGNLIRADNRYAHVRRTYTQSNLLSTDTLHIRTYTEPGPTACSASGGTYYGGYEWTQHVYTVKHTYDQSGRLTQVTTPFSQATENYAYDPTTGALASVTDGLSRTTSFSYDAAGRLWNIAYPNEWADTRTLDADDRITTRYVSNNGGPTYALSDQLAYDAAGRALAVNMNYRNGFGTTSQDVQMAYGALGAVIGAYDATLSGTGSPTTEFDSVDALGNRRWTEQQHIKPPTYPDQNGIRINSVDDVTGHLTAINAPYYPQYSYAQALDYDGDGNLFTTAIVETDYYNTGSSLLDGSVHYYDAADRLRVFNRQVGPGVVGDDQRPGERSVFEEYRYDALGRRIELRSRRESGCSTSSNAECASVIQRFVWDGDALVEEIRASGKTTDNDFTLESDNASDGQSTGFALGRVAYVHAPGVLPIDEPVAILRSGMTGEPSLVTMYPHASWRGGFIIGTTDGGQVAAGSYSGPPVQWPAAAITVDGQIGNPSNMPSWMGSLLTGSSDGSGMQYRRNRYYDPQTGRFTQQDPAGLGGGMNLYGFASGDPVNFSDPFGLMACKDASGNEILCPEPEGGPPVALPDGKNGKANSWEPVAGSAGGTRDVKYKPRWPVPTETGTQPGASWDGKQGHWDVKGLGGQKGTRRFLPDGTEVDHDNNPVKSPASPLDRIRDFLNQPVPSWFPTIPPLPAFPSLPLPFPIPVP